MENMTNQGFNSSNFNNYSKNNPNNIYESQEDYNSNFNNTKKIYMDYQNQDYLANKDM